LGVRWDYFGVIHEESGLLTVYDPKQPNFGLIARDPLYNKDFNNFAPRVSVAWDPFGKGKTVVRAGVGVFFDDFSQDAFTGQIFENSFNAGMAYNPVGSKPVFVMKPTNPSTRIVPGQPIFVRDVTSDAATAQKDLRTPYVYNYNLNLQQELFRNTVLQVGYVGSTGRKLLRLIDINQPTQAEITAFDAVNPPSSYSAGVPRPLATPLSSLEPFAPFYVNELQSSANSNYNSLQVSLTQRSWHGFTHQVSYTWSHSIDLGSAAESGAGPQGAAIQNIFNTKEFRGSSDFDMRDNISANFLYELPFGRNKMLFHDAPGWVNQIIGGWQVSSVLNFRTGEPLRITQASGIANSRPDYNGGNQVFDDWRDTMQYLDRSAYTLVPTSPATRATVRPGNQNSSQLQGPGRRRVDLTIAKAFHLGGQARLQVRFESFNVFNWTQYNNPNTTVTSPTFGLITNVASTRTGQVGLRLTF